MRRLLQVKKRDGRVVPFRREKIADAIFRAARSVGGEDRFLAQELAGVVCMQLERLPGGVPTIEDIQDVVERVLIETGHARTAKAYILYRERRAAARAARAAAAEEARPLVTGDEGEGTTEAWSKAALAEALVAADGIEPAEAEDVVRRVEERILASGLARVPRRLLHALAQAEMLDRGRASRLGEDARPGVARARITAWLDRGPDGRRALDPDAFSAAVGEAVLARYVQDEVLPATVVEAHRVADLHVHDLGAPVAVAATALPLRRLLERHLGGHAVGWAGGPRRIAAALGLIIARHAPYAARCLALEDVNVLLAPFFRHLDEDALAEEVRELLLQPAVAAYGDRGGARVLEWGLSAGVPARLAGASVPDPAPPGRTFGDHADAALRLARALLREAAALRREGHAGGPRFTLVLQRGRPLDAAARALVRQALGMAAELGEPLMVFEDADVPSRGSRWFRQREDEAPDPVRFRDGDVSAATATSLNLVGAALRAGRGGVEAFLADLDRLVRIALDGATARLGLLERAGAEPGGSLWRMRRGPVPHLDLEAAVHLLEPVGLDRAARLLEPTGDEAWRAAFRTRIRRHLQRRAGTEAEPRGLQVALVEGLGGEAAERLARIDAQRFPRAASWWGAQATPSYAAAPPPPGEMRREPAWPDRRAGTRDLQRLRHRVDGERRPPLDDLLASLEAAADDATVVEYALEPWPRRLLRGEAARRTP